MSITNATPVAFRRHTQSVERVEVAANGVVSSYHMDGGLVLSHGQCSAWAACVVASIAAGGGMGFEVPFRER